MNRTTAVRALLTAALVGTTFPFAALAQAVEPTLEGTEWHLISYAADGEVHQVPGDVDATLPLESGQVYGSAGCNGFGATYEIDGQSLTFNDPGTTDVACERRAMRVEEAYMAALPRTASWAIDVYGDTGPTPIRGHNLVLYDAVGEPILEFAEPSVDQMFATLRALYVHVSAQQRQIDRLERQLDQLRKQVGE